MVRHVFLVEFMGSVTAVQLEEGTIKTNARAVMTCGKGKQGTKKNREPENLTKRGETGKQGSQKENTGCCAVRR